MNYYAVIILAALVANFFLEFISDILNIKSLNPEVPQDFVDIYDKSVYEKSQRYTKAQTKFGIISACFSLFILLVFWFAAGFNSLDLFVRNMGFGPIWTGLIYIGLLLLLKTVLFLPFQLYSTFVLEERFGFNRTRPSTFVLDFVKGLILAIILGGPLLASVLALFGFIGPKAWFYCWLVVIVFILFVHFIAPTWILPFFNKFSPLEDKELKDEILNYAKSVNFSIENISVMDGSRRSSKSNAFFTGFGKHKRIALFDTLIEKHPTVELVAILAHEIGHYKKKHILQGMLLSILHMGVMLFLLSIFLGHQGLFDAFYMEHTSTYAGLIFFGLLLSPIEMVLSVLIHFISRVNEYEADKFAVKTIPNPSDMILALKKLSKTNLSNLTPHPFHVFLNYSHPPVLQRIHAIQSYSKE